MLLVFMVYTGITTKHHGGFATGVSVGAATGILAMTLIWWPMVNRARKERDLWIHNAYVAKGCVEGLQAVMRGETDGPTRN